MDHRADDLKARKEEPSFSTAPPTSGWGSRLAPRTAVLILVAGLLLPPALHAQAAGSPSTDARESRAGERTTLDIARADLRHLAGCSAGAPGDAVELQRLRSLYILAISYEEELERAEVEAARLARTMDGPAPALVRSYQGALTVLRAKHGFWPVARMRDLRAGLAELDRQVGAHPDHLEVRYLRLVSTAFLPSLLGRNADVRADLDAVARLLPTQVGQLPSRTLQAMGDTTLELLPTDDPRRLEVTAALERDRSRPVPLAPGCQG